MILSLMPATQLTQKQVGVVPWSVDVVQNRRTAKLTRVIDYEIAKSEDALRNGCGNSDVLNLGERNVAGRPRNQTVVDFNFRIRQRVPNHVAFEVVIRRNQKQRERDRDGDVNRDVAQQRNKLECN